MSDVNLQRSAWERSYNYRDVFFQSYDPPYRCRYCNRKLAKKYLTVDHIVPVAGTRKSFLARWILKSRGIKTVNDPRNLCASCRRCNASKGAKMGLWLIRGWLGQYRAYWITLYLLAIGAFLAALTLLAKVLPPLLSQV